MPKVALVYLAYNMGEYLTPVIDAISKLDYPKDNLLLILVTAGSQDNVAERIKSEVLPRQGQDLPECVLLDDGVNRGFAGNNNQGMRYGLDHGCDYIFLHNGDLKLAPASISELVKMAESDQKIGSVQSLIKYWKEPSKINVSGGEVHIAGYGFARDNGIQDSELKVKDGEEITYASGAAVLYRSSALRKVGLLEEGFFMYHEDLELGLRLRMAGYKNVIATKSVVLHDYSFKRNPMKFAWMELYRQIVILSYFRLRTLLLFSPLLFAIEVGTWFMALKGGWIKAKLWSTREWFKPRTWKLLRDMRKRAQTLRVINDSDLLKLMVGKIEHQEVTSAFMDKMVNPAVDQAFQAGRRMIYW